MILVTRSPPQDLQDSFSDCESWGKWRLVLDNTEGYDYGQHHGGPEEYESNGLHFCHLLDDYVTHTVQNILQYNQYEANKWNFLPKTFLLLFNMLVSMKFGVVRFRIPIEDLLGLHFSVGIKFFVLVWVCGCRYLSSLNSIYSLQFTENKLIWTRQFSGEKYEEQEEINNWAAHYRLFVLSEQFL